MTLARPIVVEVNYGCKPNESIVAGARLSPAEFERGQTNHGVNKSERGDLVIVAAFLLAGVIGRNQLIHFVEFYILIDFVEFYILIDFTGNGLHSK